MSSVTLGTQGGVTAQECVVTSYWDSNPESGKLFLFCTASRPALGPAHPNQYIEQ
jgi:hypothetical protein